MSTPDPSIAYLAQGKLYHKPSGKDVNSINSDFLQELLDRRNRANQRTGWKQSGMMWNVTAQQDWQALAQAQSSAMATGARMENISAVCIGQQPGEIFYSLNTQTIGGIFRYNITTGHEDRIAHKQNLQVRQLTVHPDEDLAVCSISYEDGSANLATMRASGGKLAECTEGDSCDEAPRWVRGKGKLLVYQSVGIARDMNGLPLDISAYAIKTLDLDSGEIKTLVEEPGQDCFHPRLLADGTLYFISRPYKSINNRVKVTPWQLLKDIVLFPIRVCMVIFAFLDMLSNFLTGKHLTAAGGARKQGPDVRQMLIAGRLVQMQQQQRAENATADTALAPKDWQLIRQDTSGNQTVLQSNVLSFDICSDGSYVYTDGLKVIYHDIDGNDRELAKGALIEHVAVTF
jgi:hypothetical protein